MQGHSGPAVFLLGSAKGLFAYVAHSLCTANPLLNNAAVMSLSAKEREKVFLKPLPTLFYFHVQLGLQWSNSHHIVAL